MFSKNQIFSILTYFLCHIATKYAIFSPIKKTVLRGAVFCLVLWLNALHHLKLFLEEQLYIKTPLRLYVGAIFSPSKAANPFPHLKLHLEEQFQGLRGVECAAYKTCPNKTISMESAQICLQSYFTSILRLFTLDYRGA